MIRSQSVSVQALGPWLVQLAVLEGHRAIVDPGTLPTSSAVTDHRQISVGVGRLKGARHSRTMKTYAFLYAGPRGRPASRNLTLPAFSASGSRGARRDQRRRLQEVANDFGWARRRLAALL